jgi:hypothetical protein
MINDESPDCSAISTHPLVPEHCPRDHVAVHACGQQAVPGTVVLFQLLVWACRALPLFRSSRAAAAAAVHAVPRPGPAVVGLFLGRIRLRRHNWTRVAQSSSGAMMAGCRVMMMAAGRRRRLSTTCSCPTRRMVVWAMRLVPPPPPQCRSWQAAATRWLRAVSAAPRCDVCGLARESHSRRCCC